jgi:hypothetical protein
MIPLDDALRPQWLFGATVHEGCDRAGYYEQGDFAKEYGSPKCIVKLGCWGPCRQLQRAQARLDQRRRRVPERRRHLHRLHDAGLPDNSMPFMDEPPGSRVSTASERVVRHRIRGLRRITHKTVDEEPKRRKPGKDLPHWLQARVEVEMAIKKPDANGLVEMAWDPITRIVGSLGIYTKIDFGKGNRPNATARRRSSVATASS